MREEDKASLEEFDGSPYPRTYHYEEPMGDEVETQHRPENGSMRFGDDWAGVFIRGDMAHAYAVYLKESMPQGESMGHIFISELIALLESCDHNQATQILKPFEACNLITSLAATR